MFQICDLQKVGQGNEAKMRNDVIQSQISTFIKVVRRILALVITVSEILTFQIFNHQKLGQGNEVQFSMMPFDGKYENLQTSYFTF